MTTKTTAQAAMPTPDPFIGQLTALATHMTFYRLGGIDSLHYVVRLRAYLSADSHAEMLAHAVAWAETLINVRIVASEHNSVVHLEITGDLPGEAPFGVNGIFRNPSPRLLEAAPTNNYADEMSLDALRTLAAGERDDESGGEQR